MYRFHRSNVVVRSSSLGSDPTDHVGDVGSTIADISGKTFSSESVRPDDNDDDKPPRRGWIIIKPSISFTRERKKNPSETTWDPDPHPHVPGMFRNCSGNVPGNDSVPNPSSGTGLFQERSQESWSWNMLPLSFPGPEKTKHRSFGATAYRKRIGRCFCVVSTSRSESASALCFSMKKQHLLMLDHGEGPRESGYVQMKLKPVLRTFLSASRPRHFSLVENSYSTLQSTLSLDSGGYRT